MWNNDDIRQWEVEQITKRISEIERIRRLQTDSEIEELNALKERLYIKRKNCMHSYKIEVWFTQVQRVCSICGNVDHNYNHYRDGK